MNVSRSLLLETRAQALCLGSKCQSNRRCPNLNCPNLKPLQGSQALAFADWLAAFADGLSTANARSNATPAMPVCLLFLRRVAWVTLRLLPEKMLFFSILSSQCCLKVCAFCHSSGQDSQERSSCRNPFQRGAQEFWKRISGQCVEYLDTLHDMYHA